MIGSPAGDPLIYSCSGIPYQVGWTGMALPNRTLLRGVRNTLFFSGIVFLLLGIRQRACDPRAESARNAVVQQLTAVRVYQPDRICTDTPQQGTSNPTDHSNEHTEQFDIVLRDGCFGTWVLVPRYWRGWTIDFVSEEPDRHVGIWYFGWSRSQGSFGPNKIPEYSYPPSNRWRLQGKGTLRYIRTS